MANVNIKELISRMTFEEKVGQLMQFNANMYLDSDVDITGPLAKMDIDKKALDYVGSVLNFKNAKEMMEIQDKHMAADRLKIPMIFMMDVIHGCRTIFPIPLAIGSSFDPELAKECAEMMAREASASGINVTFAPMSDLVRDNRWGRVMESCGEDPYLNSVMCAAQVEGIQGDDLRDTDHIAGCVKHIAAYGAAESGKDYNQAEMSERMLREYYLPAYKACVDAGVRLLMPSFNNLNGVPSTANKWLIQDIVRGEWGFDGVIISDYAAVSELIRHGVAENKKEAAEMCINNSCDIEMVSVCYCKHLRELVDGGRVKQEDIDRCVERVLQLKLDLGLFDDPYRGASPEREAEVCNSPQHREIARRSAEEASVLLKNNGVLPFSENVKRIALIGPHASTTTLTGEWSCYASSTHCVSVEEGIRSLLPNAEITVTSGCNYDDSDRDGFREAVEAAKAADAVILCLGEPREYATEGRCRANTALPGVQSELAEAVVNANPNTAAVIFSGRPLALSDISRTIPAILYGFFPGSEGGNAVANLMFGRANPCAKVSMSFPKASGQSPLYYNCTSTGRPKSAERDDEIVNFSSSYIDCGNKALYPFGYGLSYTAFEYESLELDKTQMTADEEITVTVTVRNSGSRDGKEVVQLYMRDVFASAVRPVQQLIGFKKIFLKAGETKTVEFKIKEEMLRFYNFACEHISEAGEFRISTGYADNLIHTKSFWLK